MNKEIRRTRWAGALALAGAFAVVAGTADEARAQLRRGGQGGYESRQSGGGLRGSGLRASVDTDRVQYPAGRAVEITLRLANRSDRSFEIHLDDYEYDVLIREARTGATVWQWSRQSRGARRDRRSVQWDPRQTRTWRVLWDQTDASGRRVRPGTYRIEARLYPTNVVSTEVRLTGNGGDDGYDDDPPRRRDPFPSGRLPGRFPGGGDYRDNDDLRADLRASENTVRPGDTVTLTYTIQNDTGRRQTYRFSTSQQYDIVARSDRGRTVWRSSEGRMYTQALTELTLEAGQRHTYTFPWRLDRDLDDGRYEVVAFLTPRGSSRDGAGRDGVASARTFVRVDSRDGRGDDDPVRSVSVRELLDNASDYLGRRVRVRGEFGGLRADRGGPLGSRNEWVLRSGDRILYVRRGLPRDARSGDPVTVTGVLHRTGDGQTYLEAE